MSNWTKECDESLLARMNKRARRLARVLNTTPEACVARYCEIVRRRNKCTRASWSEHEDDVIRAVAHMPQGCVVEECRKKLPHRTAKACRHRLHSFIRPVMGLCVKLCPSEAKRARFEAHMMLARNETEESNVRRLYGKLH